MKKTITKTPTKLDRLILEVIWAQARWEEAKVAVLRERVRLAEVKAGKLANGLDWLRPKLRTSAR